MNTQAHQIPKDNQFAHHSTRKVGCICLDLLYKTTKKKKENKGIYFATQQVKKPHKASLQMLAFIVYLPRKSSGTHEASHISSEPNGQSISPSQIFAFCKNKTIHVCPVNCSPRLVLSKFYLPCFASLAFVLSFLKVKNAVLCLLLSKQFQSLQSCSKCFLVCCPTVTMIGVRHSRPIKQFYPTKILREQSVGKMVRRSIFSHPLTGGP